jgi:hypothetical protein
MHPHCLHCDVRLINSGQDLQISNLEFEISSGAQATFGFNTSQGLTASGSNKFCFKTCHFETIDYSFIFEKVVPFQYCPLACAGKSLISIGRLVISTIVGLLESPALKI